MKIHDLKLSNGIKTFNGKLIIGENVLYFICHSKGNALLKSAGISQGGVAGGILMALADSGSYGKIDENITEEELEKVVKIIPDSIVFKAEAIEKIHQNIFVRYIKWNGKKMGVPSGFSKALKNDLHSWAFKHQIKTSGI